MAVSGVSFDFGVEEASIVTGGAFFRFVASLLLRLLAVSSAWTGGIGSLRSSPDDGGPTTVVVLLVLKTEAFRLLLFGRDDDEEESVPPSAVKS